MVGFKNRSIKSPANKAGNGRNKLDGVKVLIHKTEVLPIMDRGNVVALFIYNGYAIKEFMKTKVTELGGSVTFQTKSDGVEKFAEYVNGYWEPSDGSDMFTIGKEVNDAIYNDMHTTVNAGYIFLIM
jgi:hypothetical protein